MPQIVGKTDPELLIDLVIRLCAAIFMDYQPIGRLFYATVAHWAERERFQGVAKRNSLGGASSKGEFPVVLRLDLNLCFSLQLIVFQRLFKLQYRLCFTR